MRTPSPARLPIRHAPPAGAILVSLLGLSLALLPACSSDDDCCASAPSSSPSPDDSSGDPRTSESTDTRDPGMTSTETLVERRISCGNGSCEPHEDATTCPEDCSDAPVGMHDPEDTTILRFPDDHFTRDDPESLTGLRLHFDVASNPDRNIWRNRNVNELFNVLDELDGFGTQAGGFFRFSRRLAPDGIQAEDGPTPEAAGSAIIAGWLGDDGEWNELPVEAVLLAPSFTRVMIRPMLPIPPMRQAVFAIGPGLQSVDGTPAVPSPWLRALLAGDAPEPHHRLVPRYQSALQAMIRAGVVRDADDLVAMTVFTTQSIFEDTQRTATAILDHQHEVVDHSGCTTGDRYRTCRLTLRAGNWRNDLGYLEFTPDGSAPGFYDLPVVIYLPLEGAEDTLGRVLEPPYRTAIYSHGLGSSRDEARRLAEHTIPYGLAVAAVDAPLHGDHPTGDPSMSDEEQVLQFLGFGGAGALLDARSLRDNFRTAALDKLALLALISTGLDASNDGATDLAQDNFAFIGMSLGSIMGPEFLALAKDIRVAVIAIGGARITDIIQYSQFSGLILLYAGAGNRDDVNASIYPLLQTAIERADPGNWAPHVITNRFDEEPEIQILKGMSLDDEVVPDETNVLMARALDLPHIPPVLRPVGLVPVLESRTVSGNLPGGGTAGYLQFDLIQRDDGWIPTRHARLPDNPVGLEAWNHFLERYFETGVAEIIDPYAALGRDR
ncbi:MAG: hypothetical protein EA398_03360 [Deltaproteobacteria bacterium]|nr:MAG: hypothetical protein EA398_03360 [Deltaproteobacteria bacterium]